MAKVLKNKLQAIRSIKNVANIDPDKVFTYGLMAIALFIMVAKLNHVIEYIFIGLLILWLCTKLVKTSLLVKTFLDLPLFLFVVWGFATVPFAIDPSYSFAEWRKTVLQICMFYLVVNVLTTKQQVRQILLAFISGVALLSVIGILDYVVKGDSLFDKSSHADSLTSAGQWFSSYLVMGAPFLWLFFLESQGKPTKWLIGSCLLLLIVALFLSHTRGAWVAFIVQLMVLWLIRVRNQWLKWGGIIVACGAMLLGGQWFKENQVTTIPFASLDSMNIRLDIWQIALDQIRDKPFLGYGYGNQTFQKTNEEMADGSRKASSGMHLHNVFISMVYEIGLIGFVLFLLLFFFILKTALS